MKKIKSVAFKAADRNRRQERFDSFKKRLFYIFGQLQSRGWVRTGDAGFIVVGDKGAGLYRPQ